MTPGGTGLTELVVCSLEIWDEVWRRNQFFVDGLLARNDKLRVLFVEPPHDLVHDLTRRRFPRRPALRRLSDRLSTFRPVKPLPRAAGPWADRALAHQVRSAARQLGFTAPVLWVNDLAYAELACRAEWPVLYDITDDWLVEASVPPRIRNRRARQEARLLASAAEVVVCSPALAASRGAVREVRLIPNGVDVARFTRPAPRPVDLPAAPVAVYVGTLHDERLDVELVLELADSRPGLRIALVGPDSLSPAARNALVRRANVNLLGARPHDTVPGYLQHADVLIVPHRVNEFTESLDPIKAYECLATARPTVATQVAGFRELPAPVESVARDAFVDRVAAAAADPGRPAANVGTLGEIDWSRRCAEFEAALAAASSTHRR